MGISFDGLDSVSAIPPCGTTCGGVGVLSVKILVRAQKILGLCAMPFWLRLCRFGKIGAVEWVASERALRMWGHVRPEQGALIQAFSLKDARPVRGGRIAK